MIPFLGPIVSGIFGIGKQYLSNKAEKSKAKHDQELAVIRGDQNWDEIQARNSGESWKDEYLTVIITAPFIAMFLAAVLDKREMVERIGEAFIILQSEVPEQYWTLLIIAFSASFGIKGVIKGTKTFIDGKKK
jgi:hypothetical protein|tara:strand:- start:1634 stop:2032 length:399 start_codon:yes stop_codon:yes gene_type:complete